MKIATWNVNSVNMRLFRLINWLKSAKAPDIICLQETKTIDSKFPLAAFTDIGYQAIFHGQKSYNGVAIIVKAGYELTDIAYGFSEDALLNSVYAADARLLAVTCQLKDRKPVRILSVYVPNGQVVDSEKYHAKLRWLKVLGEHLKRELQTYPELLIAGDFNVTRDDQDVEDVEYWQGRILCSEPERAALAQLLDLGLVDVFRVKHPEGKIYSWWDYTSLSFARNDGLRIDLLLASEALAQRLAGAYVERDLRKAGKSQTLTLTQRVEVQEEVISSSKKIKRQRVAQKLTKEISDKPSDHAPVVGEFS